MAPILVAFGAIIAHLKCVIIVDNRLGKMQSKRSLDASRLHE